MAETKWLRLKEAAKYCGMAYQTARLKYPSWRKFGVTAHKINRNPLFKVEELDRMIELRRVN